MLKQRHQLFVALLVLLDAVVVIAASMTAWGVRVRILGQGPFLRWEEPPRQAQVLFTVPIVLFCLQWFGLYRPRRDR